MLGDASTGPEVEASTAPITKAAATEAMMLRAMTCNVLLCCMIDLSFDAANDGGAGICGELH